MSPLSCDEFLCYTVDSFGFWSLIAPTFRESILQAKFWRTQVFVKKSFW